MTPPPRLKVRLEGADLCWRLRLCLLYLRLALAHMVLAARGADAGVAADAALELVLARDEDVAELNSLHMGCAGPTNVLSFPNGPEESGEVRDLGSLVLSVDAVRREALLYGQAPREHCRRLLAHGLAHLIGLDHGEEMDSLCRLMLAEATGAD